MDANEVARQKGATLHFKAVQKGLDPWFPYTFAIAEAKRRDIEVTKVPKGDPRLCGARATFDPDSYLILHEDVENDFTHAFLVAHELGHIEIHGELEASTVYVLEPDIVAEAAPVGSNKIIDYNSRERREIQMDLFAREFLIPRTLVRRWYLEEGYSASEIATRLQSDFATVAQQLLDALLLPRVEPTSLQQEKKTRTECNLEQKAAAEYQGSVLLLEAGPGTGKTQTLVSRIEWLLAQGADPQHILVLTFTNKAARELLERVASRSPNAAAMWVGTFHAFGHDIIRRFHDELSLPYDFRLLDRLESIQLLEENYARLPLNHYKNLSNPTVELNHILHAISRAKDEVVDVQRYQELANDMCSQNLDSAHLCKEIGLIYESYEAIKGEAGCVDFGDLVSKPVRLVENNREVRKALRERHRYILVDEYQDVNRASVRLLQSIAGNSENLWVVGDQKQSIYRFRGASSDNLSQFKKNDFPNSSVKRLVTNYRSSEEIIATLNRFESQMQVSQNRHEPLISARGVSNIKPIHYKVKYAEDEIMEIADRIQELTKGGLDYKDHAVLCTGNDRLAALAEGLEDLGIPVMYLGKIFEREEIKRLLSIISLLYDSRGMGLVRLGASLEFPISLPELKVIIEHLGQHAQRPMRWSQEGVEEFSISSQAQNSLKHLSLVLKDFNSFSYPWKVLASVILDGTRIAKNLCGKQTIQKQLQGVAIWQLMNFLKAQTIEPGTSPARLLQRIRQLVLLSEDGDLRQMPLAAQGINGVRLMTVHKSKGLEFPVVHIAGLNEFTIPRRLNLPACPPPKGLIYGAEHLSGIEALKADHEREQECLFYVAMSRAKDQLILYSKTKMKNGKDWRHSRFLDLIRPCIDVNFRLCSVVKGSLCDDSKLLEDRKKPILTMQQIFTFTQCPRRFFYTYVLNVGGRQTSSPFMLTHKVVHETLQWLTSDARADKSLDETKRKYQELWSNSISQEPPKDFHQMGWGLLQFFMRSRNQVQNQEVKDLQLQKRNGTIILRPSDVLTKPVTNRTVVRWIYTGKKNEKHFSDIRSSLMYVAAQKTYPGSDVELVHLSSRTITPLLPKDFQLDRHSREAERILANIHTGHFRIQPKYKICPRCPAFFICGSMPSGIIKK